VTAQRIAIFKAHNSGFLHRGTVRTNVGQASARPRPAWRHVVSPEKSQIFASFAKVTCSYPLGSTAGFMPQRESLAFPSMWKGQSEPRAASRTQTDRRTLSSITQALALGILLVGDVLSAGTQAHGNQQDKWCAYFTGGPTYCTFASFAKCLDAIRGKTALCDQNPEYGRPASPQADSAPIKRPRHRAAQGLRAGSPAEQNSSAGAAGPSWFEDFREWLSRPPSILH
jgi:hypothetical protein